MTYHKGENRLRCHFCGSVKPLPTNCPACGKSFIKYFGVGTEQVEEAPASALPGGRYPPDGYGIPSAPRTRCSRCSAHFRAGEAQFLVGTQMIAKGT